MPVRRDPFANFERMRREMDELFGDVFARTGLAPHRRGGFSPAVDISYSGEPPRVVVTAELAGIKLDELRIEVEGHELVIAGRRPPPDAPGRAYQQIEIEHGPFRRAIQLGVDVAAADAHATYQDGILRIELPLAPAAKGTHRVPVETAAPPGEGEGEP
jgi:HSP20 family protein